MRLIYLYTITNMINNKLYIGQSVKPNQRWSQHKAYAKRDTVQYIHRAMAKYGIDSFRFDIIATCRTEEDANELETVLIKQYNSRNKQYGYNIAPGGNISWNRGISKELNPLTGRKHSEEQNIEKSERMKRWWADLPQEQKSNRMLPMLNACIGRVQSKEEKAKHSVSLLKYYETHESCLMGYEWSPEIIEKRTKALIATLSDPNYISPHIGQHHSQETEFKKGSIPWNRKLTLAQEAEILLKFQNGQSKRSLSREYNIDRTSITRIVKGTKI